MLEEEKNNRDGNESSDGQPKKRRRIRVGDANTGGSQERTPYRSSEEGRIPRQEGRFPRQENRSPRQEGGYQRQESRFPRPEGRPQRTITPRREYSDNRNYSSDRGGYRSGDSRSFNSDQRDNGYQQQRDFRSRSYSQGQSQGPRRFDNNRNEYQQRGQNHSRTNSNNFRKPLGSPTRYIKPIKYKENISPETEIRLNKYLANAGICSRREADSFITNGDVKVNGVVVTELGTKIKYGDKVLFRDKDVEIESKVYVLLNKPKNCVTTSDDPQNRLTVMDLVKNACTERIYPVGRLDRNTTGVLLLTNDGDLASKLMHPKYKKKKIYQVTLERDVAPEDMQAIADGIELDDGEIHADSISYNSEDKLNVVGIEIHSGRNRIVRRIFEKLGYKVMKLDRVYFSGLTKKNVTRGKWRYLTAEEVNMLRMGAFE